MYKISSPNAQVAVTDVAQLNTSFTHIGADSSEIEKTKNWIMHPINWWMKCNLIVHDHASFARQFNVSEGSYCVLRDYVGLISWSPDRKSVV
jgi:hypothetical protein